MGRVGHPAGAELIVRARGLAVRFGGRVALESLDLDLAPGEIVGLLGPNGAGKTSTLRLLATGRAPSAGSLSILDLDPRRAAVAIRRRLGVAGDEPVHFDALTGFENALGFAAASGLRRAEAGPRLAALFETFGLEPDAHRAVAEYSLGMRRKLLLVEALAHDPRLLVLDEPTGGLDLDARAVLARVLRERARAGAAVVLATHDVAFGETCCDRVILLRAGKVVASGAPAELIAAVSRASRLAPRAPTLSDVFLDVTGEVMV